MPIGLDKAPDTLPKAGKRLWIGTFNGVLASCEGSTQECDERAARVAWDNIKKKYRKAKDGNWVKLPMSAKSETETVTNETDPDSNVGMEIISDDGLIVRAELIISKASLTDDGMMRWACTASDTGQDRYGEAATLGLYKDWIDRISNNVVTPWLPEPPRMPFLGLSHYPDLGGYGEAGPTRKMYIDGDVFKASGEFYSDRDHPLGPALFEAIRNEKAMVKKSGQEPESPIRISAAWYDIQHSHGDFIFTRRSLTDKCPLCRAGQLEGKRYLRGQVNHFAATRVPINPRTSIDLTEKSMPTITRKDDANSIIEDEELVNQIDKRAKLVGKSEAADDNDPVLVIMAGGFGKRMAMMRKKKKMSREDLAESASVEMNIIKALEDEDEEMEVPKSVLKKLAKAVGMPDDEVDGMFDEEEDKPKMKKKSEADDTAQAAESEEEEEPEDEPETQKGGGVVYAVGEDTAQAMRPFGGATTLQGAQEWIEAQERKAQVASNFDMYMAVMANIDTAPDVENKERAKAAVTRELADRIETLKSAVADAWLISPVEMGEASPESLSETDFEQYLASQADDYEDDGEEEPEADTLKGASTMTEEVTKETPQAVAQDRATEELETVYQEVMADKSLTKDQRAAKIQEALGSFAQKAQTALETEEATPEMQQANLIAEAVKAAVAPLYEQFALFTAKSEATKASVAAPDLSDMSVTQEPIFQMPPTMADLTPPTQKSAAAPVVPGHEGNNGGQLPISPYTGQPSKLRQAILQTVRQ